VTNRTSRVMAILAPIMVLVLVLAPTSSVSAGDKSKPLGHFKHLVVIY